jgi:hypothetical protein
MAETSEAMATDFNFALKGDPILRKSEKAAPSNTVCTQIEKGRKTET